jgi:hypothetical protein
VGREESLQSVHWDLMESNALFLGLTTAVFLVVKAYVNSAFILTFNHL